MMQHEMPEAAVAALLPAPFVWERLLHGRLCNAKGMSTERGRMAAPALCLGDLPPLLQLATEALLVDGKLITQHLKRYLHVSLQANNANFAILTLRHAEPPKLDAAPSASRGSNAWSQRHSKMHESRPFSWSHQGLRAVSWQAAGAALQVAQLPAAAPRPLCPPGPEAPVSKHQDIATVHAGIWHAKLHSVS